MTDTVDLLIAVLGHEPQIAELTKELNKLPGVKAKSFEQTKDWEAAAHARALAKHGPFDLLVLPWPEFGGEEDMHYGMLSFETLSVGKPKQVMMYVQPKKGLKLPENDRLPRKHLHRLFQGSPDKLVRRARENARLPEAA